jgi:hypothetical protein
MVVGFWTSKSLTGILILNVSSVFALNILSSVSIANGTVFANVSVIDARPYPSPVFS